jgi:NitT/TauT family transport system ATP-binding protein
VTPIPGLVLEPQVSDVAARVSRDAGITVDHVAHTYVGQHGHVEALRGIDLHVPSGQFVALLGPSGCGKSTLLRIVSGLLEPSAGRVLLAGAPPSMARKRRAIGWLAQEDGLLPWRTVQENVDLPRRLAHRGEFGAAPAMLRRVGLESSARQYPHELSGGMRQRAALARALVAQPPFVLLDEPFAHLDELTHEGLGELLLELRAHQSTADNELRALQPALRNELRADQPTLDKGFRALQGAPRNELRADQSAPDDELPAIHPSSHSELRADRGRVAGFFEADRRGSSGFPANARAVPTTLLVTHSVIEAVRLAERVVVLSPRPGRIVLDLPIDLPRPRGEQQPGFGALVQHLKHALRPAAPHELVLPQLAL